MPYALSQVYEKSLNSVVVTECQHNLHKSASKVACQVPVLPAGALNHGLPLAPTLQGRSWSPAQTQAIFLLYVVYIRILWYVAGLHRKTAGSRIRDNAANGAANMPVILRDQNNFAAFHYATAWNLAST